jgi:D-alanine transfer protein
LRNILKYHFTALLFAFVVSLGSIIFLTQTVLKIENPKVETISNTKTGIDSYTYSLKDGVNAEHNLYLSLREKKGVTLLGSSELTSKSEYIPHIFATNNLNLRVSSFGHAYIQSYAMYSALLAYRNEVKNANICIIVSPGWFDTDGTNIEAFLEFATPNLLERIIKDQGVTLAEKQEIGNYLHRNKYLIASPGRRINYFINLFEYQDFPILNDYFRNRKSEFATIQYPESNISIPSRKTIDVNWEKKFNELKEQFANNVHSNKMFINDEYYEEYLKKDYKHAEFSVLKSDNQELKDLYLFVDYLKKNGANVSIIIQNLNPYHYEKLERFNPILTKMTNYLDKNDVPYLNMFTADSKDYIPGTLDDIMHTGHLGWMKINKFLVDTYGEKK